jgi:hypothetical protein
MGQMCFVLDADMKCRVCSPNELRAGAGVVISAPVGAPPRAANVPQDVKTIQVALNRFPPIQGGPAEPLMVDGLMGHRTRGAIKHFQEKWAIFPPDQAALPSERQRVDEVVDRAGPTIQRLRAGLPSDVDLPAEFARHIPRVREIVGMALGALTAAGSALGMPSGGLAGGYGQQSLAKVERYFKVSSTPAPAERVRQLQSTFQSMLTAIGHVPQGVVLAQDEPPAAAYGAYAITASGGYHRRLLDGPAVPGADPRVRPDGSLLTAIMLCPKMRLLQGEMFAYVMVHELAHYVGPPTRPDAIVDHGYYRAGAAAFARLGAEQQLRNADSYAQFAFAAIGKPDFIAA